MLGHFAIRSRRGKIAQFPGASGDPGFHRWRGFERPVDAAKIVVGEMKAVRGPKSVL